MHQTELRNSLTELHSSAFGWANVCCHGNREVAEDVLQSVYLRVLNGKAQYDGRSEFRTWLFAVIRNAARYELRQRWWSRVLRLEFERLAELTDPRRADEETRCDEQTAAIRAAMQSLPERQRQMAHLVFYQGLTVTDAAAVMDVGAGTARQHYARAKNTLRSLLKRHQTVEMKTNE